MMSLQSTKEHRGRIRMRDSQNSTATGMGADLVAKVSGFLSKGTSIHHGHMPEIELTSPTTAHGIWAMMDYLYLPNFTFKGYGHYDEDYVKENGQWKIKRILLTRLHCELEWATEKATQR